MHELLFIQDLTIVIVVAGLMTVLFRRLKQPVVLGYLLAGLIIGPHTPPFQLIHDKENIDTLAQLGIIFLMFSLGLHFSLRKLRQVGPTAALASAFEILLMLLIGFMVGRVFGWNSMDSLFLGAILSISSTTIIVRALSELGRSHEPFAHLVFGILIVEDLLGIALLALLAGIASTGHLQFGDVLYTLGRLSLFLTLILVGGFLLVPLIIRYVSKFRSKEMTLITALGICFGSSLLSVKFGYSVALGAFLAGALIAETEDHEFVNELVEPVRDLFSAIFFVSVGLLIDPSLLLSYAKPIALITLAVVIGKIFTCSLGTFIAGNDARTSLRVGMSLAQIGEFSFIIAGLGLNLGVTSAFLYPIAVMVSAITTLLTPYLIRASDPLAAFLEKIAPRPVVSWLQLYHQKIQGVQGRGKDTVFRQQMRRGGLILVVNFLLISLIFFIADYAADNLHFWFSWAKDLKVRPESISWFVAMLLSLPLLAASFRKTRALALMIGEASVGSEEDTKGPRIMRSVIANTIVLFIMAGLGIWIAYLSTALYPPRSALIGSLILLGLILIIFWRLFIRLHSKLQATLQENLSKSPNSP
jgi:Kef-type K+ transport system, predicted NAD-binding component